MFYQKSNSLSKIFFFGVGLLCVSAYIFKYSKALGNERPDVISEFEATIWQEIFKLANGGQTVHEAASNIVDNIPENFDNITTEAHDWFILSKLYRFYF